MDQHEKLTFHPFSVISEYDLDPNCGSYPKFCNKNSLMGGCSLHEIHCHLFVVCLHYSDYFVNLDLMALVHLII
jgi:hypothetical protein